MWVKINKGKGDKEKPTRHSDTPAEAKETSTSKGKDYTTGGMITSESKNVEKAAEDVKENKKGPEGKQKDTNDETGTTVEELNDDAGGEKKARPGKEKRRWREG